MKNAVLRSLKPKCRPKFSTWVNEEYKEIEKNKVTEATMDSLETIYYEFSVFNSVYGKLIV